MQEGSFLNPAAAVRAVGIHEGMIVADFGAGSGFFTRAAARAAGSRGTVWAVDANRDLLPRIAHLAEAEGLHNVEVVHGDIEAEGGSGLPPEHFDLVMACNVLFSAHNKEALVKEIRRVLKRHGKALVIDWRGSFDGLGPHPNAVVSERAARTLFEENGFTLVDPPAGGFPAGAYHWGMMARKVNR